MAKSNPKGSLDQNIHDNCIQKIPLFMDNRNQF